MLHWQYPHYGSILSTYSARLPARVPSHAKHLHANRPPPGERRLRGPESQFRRPSQPFLRTSAQYCPLNPPSSCPNGTETVFAGSLYLEGFPLIRNNSIRQCTRQARSLWWPRPLRRLRRCYPHHGLALPLHSTGLLLGAPGLDLDATTAE